MTVRLTVAQAIVRFLSVQYSERDGVEQRLIEGCFGIFGHGNLAGIGEALLESEIAAEPGSAGDLPYWTGRNEQAMVHAAVGFARTRDRLSTLAVTASVGPGATNMVTGAALATINRIPVLLLPGDVFATRASGSVLQELELPTSNDVSVNDAFRPVSRFFDRISRPEQLPAALLQAMRVLTDPVETGAVTLALPQDVQAEAHEWPEELFERRVWHVARPEPEPAVLAAALEAIRTSRTPLIIAGGGALYSGASDDLRAFVEATGIPVAETQAGRGALGDDHPLAVGAIGHTGTPTANALAAEADLVIGIGTRYSDFTTASMTLFAHPEVRFLNLNVAGFDTHKLSAISLVADARQGLRALTAGIAERSGASGSQRPDRSEQIAASRAAWEAEIATAATAGHAPLPSQTEVLVAVNESMAPHDVVVCAAGSMPGDLHRLWRTVDPKGYHVEYGYSCMGYEIPGGLGVAMAAPEREVVVMVGDGSYLMMSSELVTCVQEGIKLTVVLVQNHGFASIGALSESLGSQRFGTNYRRRQTSTGRLDGDRLPVDLAANAASLGATVLRAETIADLRSALRQARSISGGPVVIHVETDPRIPGPSDTAWWDVPVAEVSTLDTTRAARERYDAAKARQRPHLRPSARPGHPEH
ncbi:3D-(3,5/4)-trihydroxycyclohexane-1,2-dione acylhydrolase (decyclizing) [Nocardioides sp.]|uniref:3D-(3,5/4)-trihydroxycyclohexane-1,2-dione acylhydrolase (decyclizing) n=1 Tax=Nocardioides sp. TaxID=35761 RepID=UPI00262C75D1|nr:3D-(3,5/4)-trihydroxycyclohexane-1,2-dione acylhydrolase (decyclizing) [Nocardioides sp.]